MDEPKAPPSNAPLYAALLIGAALSLACLASWLGPAVIWVLLIGAALVALGTVHWWLWGRGMQPPEDWDRQ